MASRRAFTLACILGGATLLAGCGLPGSGKGSVAAGAPASVVVASPPDVVISPSDRAAGVPLDAPVVVTSSAGNLSTVAVTRLGGAPLAVAGSFSPNHRTWTASDGLDLSARYQVAVTATGAAGTHTTASATFATITSVADRLLTTSTPLDGAVVGVGEPIDLRFNTPIAPAQQPVIVRHLQVVSSPAQDGAWHWFSASELHYRPAQYWQRGTTVTVTANFHGVNAGNNVWGLAGWTKTFSVGDKHLSLIDDATHQMQVFDNDRLLYTWPVSLGKPGFRTLEGTLVVLYRTQKVKMDSCSTFGGAACIPGSSNFYSDYVYWDTAISTNGFFIHAAPWSVGSQGYADVSHGCVNLSTDRATTFYNWSQTGDVVVISHTGNVADLSNGEADWQIPFAQFDNTGVPAADSAPTVSTPGGQ